LARTTLILKHTKKLENLAKHCNSATWWWRHIKTPFTDKTDINKSIPKGKTYW